MNAAILSLTLDVLEASLQELIDRNAARTAEAENFLTALWPERGRSPEGELVIFHLPGRRDTRFSPDPEGLSGAAEDAVHVADQEQDVYVGMGLTKSTSGRGTVSDVTALPGAWLDLDILGPTHKAENLPPDADSALRVMLEVLPPPTLVLDSGGGLQVFWLSETGPWDPHAVSVTAGIQHALRTRFAEEGWGLDDTSDPARVLRVPGTKNWKAVRAGLETEPRAVRIRSNGGPRYTPGLLLAEFPAPEGYRVRRADAPVPEDEELARRREDLETWLANAGLGEYRIRDRGDGKVVAEVENCPFDRHSDDWTATISRGSEGGWIAKCVKAGCGGIDGPNRFAELAVLAPVPEPPEPDWVRELLTLIPEEPDPRAPVEVAPGVFVIDDEHEAEESSAPVFGDVIIIGGVTYEAVPRNVTVRASDLRRDEILSRFTSVEEILGRKPIDWLVPGLLQEGVTSRIEGPPAAGKSLFILQEVIRLVRTGRTVVYAPLEGRRGLTARLRAQVKEFGYELDELAGLNVWEHQVLRRTNGQKASWEPEPVFLESLEYVRPDLVIVDTQARAAAGASENDNGEMQSILDAVDKLRVKPEAAAWIVHHFGHGMDRGRGASSGQGAMDNVVHVTTHDGHDGRDGRDLVVKVASDKVKDGRKDDARYYLAREVRIGTLPGGEPWTSVVLEQLADAPDAAKAQAGDSDEQRVLDVLETLGPLSRAKVSERLGISSSKAQRLLEKLRDDGEVWVAGTGKNQGWVRKGAA